MTPLTVNTSVFFELGFYCLALGFLIHAVIFSYHWLSFGANRRTSLIGLAVYVSGGAFLLLLLGAALWLIK